MGSIKKSIVFQCVLPINIVNEKIYVFLWFWFMILTCLTVLGRKIVIPGIFSGQSRCRFNLLYVQEVVTRPKILNRAILSN